MAAVGREVLLVRGDGRGRKNGPFNGLIDLLPRRPTVVTARNENVTLYRLESPGDSLPEQCDRSSLEK